MPSYKFDKGTDVYDTSKKKRTPSWCDRVLVHCVEPYQAVCSHYKMATEVKISDHQPVIAYWTINVRKINKKDKENVIIEL